VGKLTLTVYTPPHFSKTKKYPVLYVMDGQDLFDGTQNTWQLDETLEALCKSRKMQEIIVVGLDTGRFADNSLFPRDTWLEARETTKDDGTDRQGGKAAVFLDSLLAVKKTIDHDFPTEVNDAGIMGSSLGGLFAEYAGFKHSEVFRHVGIISPSLFLTIRKNQKGSESWAPAHDPWPAFIWMDMGKNEGDEPDFHFANAMREAKKIDNSPQTKKIKFRFTPYDKKKHNGVPANHDKDSWAIRVNDALPFLYPPP